MNILLILGLMMAAASTCIADNPRDVVIQWRAVAPARTEDWSSADGFEAQLRFWDSTGTGVGLAIGVEKWRAVSESDEEADESGYFSMSVGGELTTYKLGISLLHRYPVGRRAVIVLDAGARYLLNESDIMVCTYISDAKGNDYYRDKVRVDNGILGALNIVLEVSVTDSLAFHCGLGYQLDIIRPNESFLGSEIGHTGLQGTTMSLGAVLNW